MSTLLVVPSRFLFVMWEGGGNVAPQLGLARKLVQRGHRVRVLADPCIREEVKAVGGEFVGFRRAPHRVDRSLESDIVRDFEARTPLGAFARIRDRIMFGPALAYAEDVLEQLQREPADVAVVDYTLFGAAAGAERAGAPLALLAHTVFQVPRPGVPAPGPGFLPMHGPIGRLRDAVFGAMFLRLFSTGFPKLNEARATLGLEPIENFSQVFDKAERVLVLTSPAFDYESDSLPPNVRYVGAQLDDPAWAEPWQSPWEESHPDPLVVVGLSTTYQAQGDLLQRVADALGQLPARGLVTTGPSVDPATLRTPANVVVLRSAPHAQVFREADAVVTHAGHGTVIRALANGLPLVCIPMGRDQPDIAARVVHRGAGLRLSPKASVAKLRKAIERVLKEPHFRQSAQRLQRAIRQEIEADLGLKELESLATRGVRTARAGSGV